MLEQTDTSTSNCVHRVWLQPQLIPLIKFADGRELSQFENLATGDDPTIHFVFIKITELWYLLIIYILFV